MSRTDALLARARATEEPDALLTIALALLAEGHGHAAAEAFALGVELAPARTEFDLGVAASLIAAGELDGAAAHLADHLARHPGSAAGHLQLAACERERGHRDAAVQSVLRAIHLDPDEPQALALFLEMHDPDVGAACLARFADELGAAGPRLLLAARALETDDVEAAEAELERALARMDPERVELLEQAAALLLALDRAEEVVELLESDDEDERPLGLDLLLARAYLECDEPMLARGLLPGIEARAGAAERPAVAALRSELA